MSEAHLPPPKDCPFDDNVNEVTESVEGPVESGQNCTFDEVSFPDGDAERDAELCCDGDNGIGISPETNDATTESEEGFGDPEVSRREKNPSDCCAGKGSFAAQEPLEENTESTLRVTSDIVDPKNSATVESPASATATEMTDGNFQPPSAPPLNELNVHPKEDDAKVTPNLSSAATPSAPPPPADLNMGPLGSTPTSAPPATDDGDLSFAHLRKQVSQVDPHALLRKDLGELDNATDDLNEICTTTVTEIYAYSDSQLLSFYRNRLLEESSEHLNSFLHIHSDFNLERCPLNGLLDDYRRSRNNLEADELSLERYIRSSSSLRENLWRVNKHEVKESGECQDGKELSAVHWYEVAQFDAEAASKLRSELRALKDKLSESRAFNAFQCETHKAKVQDHIVGVVSRNDENEIKKNLNVIFAFNRQKINSEVFVTDVRLWLDELAALLLSDEKHYVSTRLFLLHHVLRCPAGVGKWGAKYIQMAPPHDAKESSISSNPLSLADNEPLDLIVTVLSVLMTPVEDRTRFLNHLRDSLTLSPSKDNDATWTVVDLEGEEFENFRETWHLLTENDLVAFFHQVPFQAVFKHMLGVRLADGQLSYSNNDSNGFVHLLAFCSRLVLELRRGFKTFNRPRYRGFAKRICQIMRETLEFVTDHWEALKKHSLHEAMRRRFEVEYDSFFLRVIRGIHCGHRLGTWQYFTNVPYGSVSMGMLWRVFYVLHLDFNDDKREDFGQGISDWESVFDSRDLQIQFEQNLSRAIPQERHFLLAAFSSMISARDSKHETRFISMASLEIFRVGFVIEDMEGGDLSKEAKDQLTNICENHPFVMSLLVKEFEKGDDYFTRLREAVATLPELPFSSWQPRQEDIDRLLQWLTHEPLASTKCKVSRIVLSRMNWRYSSSDGPQLPLRYHRAVALAVVTASVALQSAQVSAGLIESSVRQVSRLAAESEEEVFQEWALKLLSHLRLHACDQTDSVCSAAVAGDREALSAAIDYDLDVSAECLSRGVTLSNTAALYTALKASDLGHNMPIICERGFGCLEKLTYLGCYSLAVEVLDSMTPLFFRGAEAAITSKEFLEALQSILSSESTLLHTVKEYVSLQFPGQVLKDFGNMIRRQIAMFKRFGFQDALPVMMFWLHTFVKLPRWSCDRPILYVIDLICEEAFFREASHKEVKKIFHDLHEARLASEKTGYLDYLLGGKFVSFLPAATTEFFYFAYFILEMENERIEERVLWKRLLMHLRNEETPLDSAIESSRAVLGLDSINPNFLPIYRWSGQLRNMPNNHQLAPIFAQRFFSYFLARPSPDSVGNDFGGVGMRFFGGLVNRRYLNSVHSKLDEMEAVGAAQNDSDQLVSRRRELFKAMSKWLVDTSVVQDKRLLTSSLSPVYFPKKLAKLIQGDHELWMEYLDPLEVGKGRKAATDEWEAAHFRARKIAIAASLESKNRLQLSPHESIVRRLEQHGQPLSGPEPPTENPVRIVIKPSIFVDEENLLDTVVPLLENIQAFVTSFTEACLALSSNISTYMELVPAQFVIRERQRVVFVTCDGTKVSRSKTLPCSGKAAIELKFEESEKREEICYRLEQGKSDFAKVLSSLRDQLPVKLSSSVLTLEYVIKHLIREYSRRNMVNSYDHSHYQRLGVKLFYRMSEHVTDDLRSSCLPVAFFLQSSLEMLGPHVISNDPRQCLPLVKRMVEQPRAHYFFMASFNPADAELEDCNDIYGKISQIPDEHTTLAISLLSKLNVNDWLNRDSAEHRKHGVAHSLLNHLERGLAQSGANPEKGRSDVHHLLKRHLFSIATHQFPVHYQRTLKLFISLIKEKSLDPVILEEFIWTLMYASSKESEFIRAKRESPSEMGHPEKSVVWVHRVSHFVKDQTRFPVSENMSTVIGFFDTMTDFFHEERLSVGPSGLYGHYENYSASLAVLYYLHGHLLLQGEIQRRESKPARPIALIWDEILGFYEPWISPMDSLGMKQWIRDMAASQKIFLPWSREDQARPDPMISSLVLLMRSFVDTFPNDNFLSYAWSYYCDMYCRPEVPTYVSERIHAFYVRLQWELMRPSLPDICRMGTAVDRYAPESHAFLGSIFAKMPWAKVLEAMDEPTAVVSQTKLKALPILLKVIVKLSQEPVMRQSGQLESLVCSLNTQNWWSVDSREFETLIQWFTLSIEPRVVVAGMGSKPIDEAMLRLLQTAGCFTSEPTTTAYISSSEVLKKRVTFVRCLAKLLITCTNKYKAALAADTATAGKLKEALADIFFTVDQVVTRAIPSQDSALGRDTAKHLLRLLLSLLDSNSRSPLAANVAQVLTSRVIPALDPEGPTLNALFEVTARSVANTGYLGMILEASLERHFKEEEGDEEKQLPGDPWAQVLGCIVLPADGDKLDALLQSSAKEGRLLLLYAFTRLKPSNTLQEKTTLVQLIMSWIRVAGFSAKMESKLPLLYLVLLQLQQQRLAMDPETEEDVVQSLQLLLDMMQYSLKTNWTSPLEAMGFRPGTHLTPRTMFFQLSLMLYVRAVVITPEGRLYCGAPDKPTDQTTMTPQNSSVDKECELLRAKLDNLSTQKAYLGLQEKIGYVLDVTKARDPKDCSHSFKTIVSFIRYLIADGLYVEKFLQPIS